MNRKAIEGERYKNQKGEMRVGSVVSGPRNELLLTRCNTWFLVKNVYTLFSPLLFYLLLIVRMRDATVDFGHNKID